MITMVDISELYDNNNLVGGFNHLETYESQWEGLSHILWKYMDIFKMLQTTKQL